jgi:hypothetical protein
MTSRALLFGLGLLALGGCADRTYLTPTHGRAYAQAFSQQLANPEPIENDGRPIQGLDSQEATTISRSYNRSLSPKGNAEPAQPTIIMNPAAAPQQGPNIPPPSVPDRQ